MDMEKPIYQYGIGPFLTLKNCSNFHTKNYIMKKKIKYSSRKISFYKGIISFHLYIVQKY